MAIAALAIAASCPAAMAQIGSGWTQQACDDIAAFSAKWNIPVASTFRRQDIVDNRLPQYAGHLSLGMNPALAERLRMADVVLAVGTRISDVATDGYTLLAAPDPVQALIHFHPDAQEVGRVLRPDLGFAVSPVAAAASLAALVEPGERVWNGWTASARDAYLTFSEVPQRDPRSVVCAVDVGSDNTLKRFR